MLAYLDFLVLWKQSARSILSQFHVFGVGCSNSESWLSESVVVCSYLRELFWCQSLYLPSLETWPSEESNGILFSLLSIGRDIASGVGGILWFDNSPSKIQNLCEIHSNVSSWSAKCTHGMGLPQAEIPTKLGLGNFKSFSLVVAFVLVRNSVLTTYRALGITSFQCLTGYFWFANVNCTVFHIIPLYLLYCLSLEGCIE